MTYHHLNRLISHSQAKLTARERLLAWHLAYQSRSKTNTFSRAGRSLELDLVMDRRTIQKNLAYLVELGLFTREKGQPRKADIYRLNISCPLGCEDLETHNTPLELKLISAALDEALVSNTPEQSARLSPQTSKVVANRKEEREEEDISSAQKVIEGSAELIFILEALETLPSLNEDQLTLKGFIELNPHAVAKAALEITSRAGLDTPKRVRTYLSKTAINSPQNLLAYAEATNASLEGTRRLTNSTPRETNSVNLEGLEPEATFDRIKLFAAEVLPSYAPTQLARPYLLKKAQKGKLTALEIDLASIFEDTLRNKAFQFLRPDFAKSALEYGSIYFDLDKEGQLVVKGNLYGQLEQIEFLYTPEEKKQLSELRFALQVVRSSWETENPEAEYSHASFFMLPEVRAVLKIYPEPLNEDQRVQRFLDYFTQTFRAHAEHYLETSKTDKDFSSWLKQNFTLEDDFNDWLPCFPERETGSHAKHAKKAYSAYVSARRSFNAEDLVMLGSKYAYTLTNLDYAKYPENFLLDLVAEPEAVAF